MPKVDKIPCPGCGALTPVKIGKSKKPYIRCDDCGIDVFVRGAKGVRKFLGEGEEPAPAAAAAPAAAGKTPAGKEEKKDGWDW
jgi:DNA-directed RNA polymerase subunit RPC12/RpoP